MSRVTPPTKLIIQAASRSISSSAKAARPSGLLDSQARASAYLPRQLRDLRAECAERGLSKTGSKADLVERLSAYDVLHTTRSFHTARRPATAQASPIYKTIPLMQGFRTSAPTQKAHDTSTIDFFFFPETAPPAPANPFTKMRVPLLPDNYNPDRSPDSAHAVEALDTAIPRPEISIVASHPEHVVPATISEVVGNDGLETSLEKLTAGFSAVVNELPEPSDLRAFWDGLLDDIFGPKSEHKTA